MVSPTQTAASRPPRILTDLARKYTAPTRGPQRILNNTGYSDPDLKNGLIPIDPGPVDVILCQDEIDSIQKVRVYQKNRFYGFTAEEWQLLEAHAPLIGDSGEEQWRDPLPTQDSQKMFHRCRWDRHVLAHRGKLALGKGRSGYWEVCLSFQGYWFQGEHD